MDDLIAWLLPLSLLLALGIPFAEFRSSHGLRTTIVSLLGLMLAALMILQGLDATLVWTGPSLFTLDSFHQLRLSLQVNWLTLPMLWIVWWWIQDKGERRSISLLVLFAIILSEDLWLWWSLCVLFIAIDPFPRSRARRLRDLDLSCQWVGVLFALFVCAMLSFDFDVTRFSDLKQLALDGEEFSESESAEFMLVTLFAGLSTCLWAAVYPISVLRIEIRNAGISSWSLTLLAAALVVKMQPLLHGIPILKTLQPLLLLTILVSLMCSISMRDGDRAMRAQLTVLIMLGFSGIMFPIDNSVFWGIEQILLTFLLWELWESDSVLTNRSWTLHAALSIWMILGLSGWPSMCQSFVNPYLGERGGQAFVFVLASVLSIRWGQRLMSSRPENVSSEDTQPWINMHTCVLLAIVLTIRLGLFLSQQPFVEVPSLQSLLGVLSGLIFLFMVHRWGRNRYFTHSRSLSVLQDLGDTQFHMLTFWQTVPQLPSGVWVIFDTLWQSRRRRTFRRKHRSEKTSSTSNESLFWEYALAGASLIVLAGVFLWQKG